MKMENQEALAAEKSRDTNTALTSHTPGPWSLPHFAMPDANCTCGYVLCDHMMGAVATVHCSGEGNDWQKHGDNPKFAEAVANARLIAAAPELLAVLTSIMSAMPRSQDRPSMMSIGQWHEARRAIAKATGAP